MMTARIARSACLIEHSICNELPLRLRLLYARLNPDRDRVGREGAAMARLERFRGGTAWALNYYPKQIANAEKYLPGRPSNYSTVAQMNVTLACIQYGVGHELAEVHSSLRR